MRILHYCNILSFHRVYYIKSLSCQNNHLKENVVDINKFDTLHFEDSFDAWDKIQTTRQNRQLNDVAQYTKQNISRHDNECLSTVIFKQKYISFDYVFLYWFYHINIVTTYRNKLLLITKIFCPITWWSFKWIISHFHT